VRAVARFDPERVSDDFRALAGTGQIAVTVEGTQASSRYQGIVPIEGDSLSESLEHYFSSSEQLPTAVRLVSSEGVTAGLLVQRVPGEGGAGVEGPAGEAARRDEAQRTFAAARAASAALDADALLLLPVAELVRLCLDGFDVRLYAPQAVRFECRCSRARVATMLRSLGAQESREVLAEQGAVTVTCEFCQKPYRFDAVDIEQLFAEVAAPPGSRSVN
jgi:molecular chaperone Hsp33